MKIKDVIRLLQSIDTDDDEELGDDEDVSKFIPPLQTELELIKKHTGVNSVYDEDGFDDDICTGSTIQPQ